VEKRFAITNLEKSIEHLDRVWKHMTNTNKVEGRHLRSIITESWKRCLNVGVNFEKKQAPLLLNESQLNFELGTEQTLIEITEIIFQQLSESIKGTGFILTLCNSNGIILLTKGDDHVLYRARINNFVEGADWSEQAAGTNAIGTCLVLNKPVQIFSSEHFCIGWQDWTCSGAPIKDPFTGKTLGVLDLSGSRNEIHPHTLSFVIIAAQMIEEKLKEWQIKKQQKLYDIIIESSSDGIIIINENDHVISMNLSSKQMLGYFFQNLSHKESILDYPEIYEKYKEIKNGKQIVNENISINKKLLLISFLPFVNGIKYSGYLILLRENQSTVQHNFATIPKIATDKSLTFSSIVTNSPEMNKAIKIAKISSTNDAPVLLLGESGTGKEMFAKGIHNEGSNNKGPFIPVNCGAISKELIESELFGYTEGAFTGAIKGGRKGKFEQASGGTLFLDEIGEMPLDMQVSLLRVLEEKMIYPVGGSKGQPVNCKIISATHKDLYKEVESRRFRQDLYYRLNVITIEIPPLRGRTGDIFLLVEYFLKRFQRTVYNMDADLLSFFQQYSWPGNVRQLKNTIERLIYLSQGSTMNANLLSSDLLQLFESSKKGLMSLDQKDNEKSLLKKVLYDTGYNHTAAAQKLGISRSTLYRKLKKYEFT
jgi:transcriptional regulator of acetoin/glycerol metabolism